MSAGFYVFFKARRGLVFGSQILQKRVVKTAFIFPSQGLAKIRGA